MATKPDFMSSILFSEEEGSKPNGNDVHQYSDHTEETRQWWRTRVSTQARPNDAVFQRKHWPLPVFSRKNVSFNCTHISIELISLGFWIFLDHFWIKLMRLWFNGLGRGNAHWWVAGKRYNIAIWWNWFSAPISKFPNIYFPK